MHKYLKVNSGLFIPMDILQMARIEGERVGLELTESEIRIYPAKENRKKFFTLDSPLWKCVGFAEAVGVNGKDHNRYIYEEKK